MMNASITVGQLIEMLNDLVRMEGEDVLEKEIFATSDYGDHCHTMQLVPLDEPTIVTATRSAYSDSGWAVGDEDDDGDSVVVLTPDNW